MVCRDSDTGNRVILKYPDLLRIRPAEDLGNKNEARDFFYGTVGGNVPANNPESP